MKTESQGNGRVAVAVWLAVLALFAIVSLTRVTLSSVGHDFYQFWSMGQASEPDGLYSSATSRAVSEQMLKRVSGPEGSLRGRGAAARNRQLYPNGVEPISTPTYYWAFAELSTGNYDVDLLGFQFISTAALLLAAWFLCRRVGYAPIAAALALTVLMLIFGPLHADIETGNTNRLQLALLAAAIALHHLGSGRGFRIAAGALLGGLVVLKPNLAAIPLFLTALWLVDRRVSELRSSALGWVLGAGAAVAIGSLAYSWESWGQWISALSVYQDQPAPIAQSNWSSARLILEWTGVDASALLAFSAVACMAASAWWGRSRNIASAAIERDVTAIGAALLVPLIASQIAWDHYFLFAAPALIMTMRPVHSGSIRQWISGAALAACAITPLRVTWPAAGPLELAISLTIGVGGLFVLLMMELAHPAENPTKIQGDTSS